MEQVANIMIIEEGGVRKFFSCCCATSFVSIPAGASMPQLPIANSIFYGEMHAMKSGWVKTDHPHFCPPDQEFQWVCPNCAKKYNWEKKK